MGRGSIHLEGWKRFVNYNCGKLQRLILLMNSSQRKQSWSSYPVQGRYTGHFQRYCSKWTRHSHSTFRSRLPKIEFEDSWSLHTSDSDRNGFDVQKTLHRDEDPWSVWGSYSRCPAWRPFQFRPSRWAWCCLEGWNIVASWSTYITEVLFFHPDLHSNLALDRWPEWAPSPPCSISLRFQGPQGIGCLYRQVWIQA